MFHFEPGPNRWKLGFKDAVIKNFQFLRRYGFRRVCAEPTFVRYETVWPFSRKRLFVNVYHGRGSYQMNVEVGQENDQGLMVPLPWIVKWSGGAKAEDLEKRTILQASSREGVQKAVLQMADLVRKYAGPFLRGEERAYANFQEEMRGASSRYERNVRLAQARSSAEVAWHAKDYEQVVTLYNPFQDDLTRSERMRLQYARKQLALSEVVKQSASASKDRC